MKTTVELLTSNERAALALFFGTDAYAAFKHLCQLEINGIAKDALGAGNMEAVNFCRGQAAMAKKLPLIVRDIYQETEKKGKQKS